MLEADVAFIPEAGRVEFRKHSLTAPGSGELLLKALYSSISPGTEHALMAGHILPLPQKLGYSMVAEIMDIGPGVDDHQPGDVVAVTAEHANYLLVDQRLATPVPDNIDLAQAALFNLAHTALYAIRQAGLQLGEACLVMGQGLVGALTAQLAKTAGAVPVVVTDILDERLALAKTMGISQAINPGTDADALSRVLQAQGLTGFPVVFEATGVREPLAEAINRVAERGRVVMMSQGRDGLPAEALQTLMMKGARLLGGYINSKPFNLYRSDLVITGSWPPVVTLEQSRYTGTDGWTSDADIRTFLSLVQHQYIDLSPLISHRFHCSDMSQAYELVWNKSPQLIAGIIDWSN